MQDDDSDSETSGRILEVSNLNKKSSVATIEIKGLIKPEDTVPSKMVTDTGVSKTLINWLLWQKIKHKCSKMVYTSKSFRPYSTTYHLLIIG